MAPDPGYDAVTISTPYGSATFDPTDLHSPSSDTFVLGLQWLYAHTRPEVFDGSGVARDQVNEVFARRTTLGEHDVWVGEEQIPELVGQILFYGNAVFPVDAGYRHFTTRQIGTAYALWQRYATELSLNKSFGAALAAAHENGNQDPR